MTVTWIAEQAVVFQYPDGHLGPGRIAVGLPSRADACETRCVTVLEGFDPSPIAISGSSTLQALLLAARFLGMRLHDFLAKRGRVLDPDDGSVMALEALFGPLLHPAAPPSDTNTPRPRTPRPRTTRRRASHRRG